MCDKNPPLPPNPPWNPPAGLIFVALLVLLSAVGGFMHLAFGARWGPGAQMVLSHGGVLLAVLIFLYARAGSLSRIRGCCALHGLSPAALLKAAAAPAFLTGAALLGWFLLHLLLRRWLGYAFAEQPQVQWLRQRHLIFGEYEFYVVVLMMVAVGPLAEELLFRMLLYLPLRGRVGPVKAMAAVSLLFAALHIYPTAGGAEFFMNAALITGHLFILSIFFTVLLERTRTLLAPVLGHVLYNTLVVGLVLSGVTG